MFDFGDELTIESYRVPWLIWIQVIVMLLLIILLFGFTLSAFDLPDCSSSSSPPPLFPQSQKSVLSVSFHPSQVGENQTIKGEIAAGITRRIVRGEDNVEKEGPSSLKEANQICFHPCHYFRLAKLAFLKCLGLDSSSENSSNSEQRNER